MRILLLIYVLSFGIHANENDMFDIDPKTSGFTNSKNSAPFRAESERLNELSKKVPFFSE